MYLVKLPYLGRVHYIFLVNDPRLEGFIGEVLEGVTYSTEVPGVPTGKFGPHLARHWSDPKSFKTFVSAESARKADFVLLRDDAEAFEYGSWQEYQAARQHRP